MNLTEEQIVELGSEVTMDLVALYRSHILQAQTTFDYTQTQISVEVIVVLGTFKKNIIAAKTFHEINYHSSEMIKYLDERIPYTRDALDVDENLILKLFKSCESTNPLVITAKEIAHKKILEMKELVFNNIMQSLTNTNKTVVELERKALDALHKNNDTVIKQSIAIQTSPEISTAKSVTQEVILTPDADMQISPTVSNVNSSDVTPIPETAAPMNTPIIAIIKAPETSQVLSVISTPAESVISTPVAMKANPLVQLIVPNNTPVVSAAIQPDTPTPTPAPIINKFNWADETKSIPPSPIIFPDTNTTFWNTINDRNPTLNLREIQKEQAIQKKNEPVRSVSTKLVGKTCTEPKNIIMEQPTFIQSKQNIIECPHFRKGYCERGSRCGYKHDPATFGIDQKDCKFWMEGICSNRVNCTYKHDPNKRKIKAEICRYQKQCNYGDEKCRFRHD